MTARRCSPLADIWTLNVQNSVSTSTAHHSGALRIVNDSERDYGHVVWRMRGQVSG